ncbi:BglG family transcription antiterminator [Alkalihalobacillus sp. R86527]|uniref:BglG family transcription antiterminator n=1 Tax=Alkalihalobacillus sp. R86527 TaxID=3093863 RepID=UPI003672A2C2
MLLSARERSILQLLLETDDFYTVKEIAEQLEVSERTVHRDLSGLEDVVNEYELKLMKKAGVGVQFDGHPSQRDELKRYLYNLDITEYTQNERETLILCKLLESHEPIKLIGLANDLRVTVATISNDLNRVEDWLHSMQLSLIRKRGYGVQVEGAEALKRHAISSLLTTEYNDSDFFTLLKQSIQKKSKGDVMESASDQLLGLVDREKLHQVEAIVGGVNNNLPYMMADSAYIGLIVHLTLAIERIQQGEKIEMESDYLSSLKETKEFHSAETISRRMADFFSIPIPEAEVGYITMHLRGAKLRSSSSYYLEESNYPITVKARQLIREVSDNINVELESNDSLFQGLVTHLGPATHRLNQKMSIHNPLLTKIKEDYPELFKVIKEAVGNVFNGVTIPDEEVGFLVLHFGSALEGWNKKNNLRILAVCSSGIGTSKMLATRLKQEFHEIDDVKSVSLFELEKEDLHAFDLIVSTIPLRDIDAEYIEVSPFLSEKEARGIRTVLQKSNVTRRKNALKEKESSFQSGHQAADWFTRSAAYSETASSIMKHLTLTEGDEEDIVALLKKECSRLEKGNTITSSDAVTEALLKREELGGVGIPESSLALFHTRTPAILQPTFSIIRLQKPVKRKAMDETEIDMDTILLQLAPEEATSEQIEIMSFISTVVIETSETITLFEEENEERIQIFLAEKLREFITDKLSIKGEK